MADRQGVALRSWPVVIWPPEGLQAAVYATDGRRLLREGEIEHALAASERRRIAELARKDAELAALRLQLEQLRNKE